MATAGERLATLEVRADEIRADLAAIRDSLDGTGGVSWERSMRGRLHKIEADVAALLMLRRAGVRLTSRFWRVTAAALGLTFAAAPYVLYIIGPR